MQYIYRIENDKRESCYSFKWVEEIGKVINDIDWFEENSKRPFPELDKGIERKIFNQEICGFVSVKQALKWFSAKEIKAMRQLKFDLKKVKVQKITAIGEKQCLAIRGN